ncbi:hypothetical protein GQ457_02G040830 [Hibiscus cannabinus]
MSNGGAKAAVAPVGGLLPLDWKLSQVFGERSAGEEVQEGGLGYTGVQFDIYSLDESKMLGSRSSFSKCDVKQWRLNHDWCTMIKVLNHDFAVNCGNFFCIVGVIENGEKNSK